MTWLKAHPAGGKSLWLAHPGCSLDRTLMVLALSLGPGSTRAGRMGAKLTEAAGSLCRTYLVGSSSTAASPSVSSPCLTLHFSVDLNHRLSVPSRHDHKGYRMNSDQQILIEALRKYLTSIEETINNLKGS